jgi:4-hydroxy-3-methylbut-2-enyl diphosphate reductase
VPTDLSGTVGVTAGASAPESLVQAVVDRLAPEFGVEVMPVTVEEEYFPPPPELRELLRGLETALSLINGARAAPAQPDPADPGPEARVLAGDRTAAAADVLDRLGG